MYSEQADGSLLRKDGKVIGSALIAQNFTKPEYFHPRPSAAKYDASASAASNLGPTNQALIDRVKADAEKFRAENPEYKGAIPSDLLTTSGSGLDPHISPASAYAQAARVARTRGVSLGEIEALVRESTEDRQLGFLGEPRVNVLRLNLLLDEHWPAGAPAK
jgi:K+-transporting ATPase ATPase C chain